jgi:uncharacterized protein (TIGR00661 family)
MRVLYGVNGEGMGHATRSEVVIRALLAKHDVRVVTSGAALRFLTGRLPRVQEVFGYTFAMGEGQIRRWRTVVQNVRMARRELPETMRHWVALVEGWKPHVVVSDFEPLTGMYARWTRTPLLAVDTALGEFVERLPEFEHALSRYEQVGNSVALRAVEDGLTELGAERHGGER